MTPTVKEIWEAVTDWAPDELAEPWDNSGLQAGNPDSPVNRVMIALDSSEGLLSAARNRGAEMVITHHPILFNPLKSFDTSKHLPRLLAGFLQSGIALAAAHTNLDSAAGGVTDLLAALLGIEKTVPLMPHESGSDLGLGRVGILSEPVPLAGFLARVADLLTIPGLLVVGDENRIIEKVAFCGGSGSDLWPAVLECEADLFITAEIKHHIAREAEQLGKAMIDAGHFYTEWPIVPALAEYLKICAAKKRWDLEVLVWEEESSPFGIWVKEDVIPGRLQRGARPVLTGNG